MTAVSEQVPSAGGAPTGRRQRRSLSPEAQDRRFGYGLVAPVVIVLAAITAYPLFTLLAALVHAQGRTLVDLGLLAAATSLGTFLGAAYAGLRRAAGHETLRYAQLGLIQLIE